MGRVGGQVAEVRDSATHQTALQAGENRRLQLQITQLKADLAASNDVVAALVTRLEKLETELGVK